MVRNYSFLGSRPDFPLAGSDFFTSSTPGAKTPFWSSLKAILSCSLYSVWSRSESLNSINYSLPFDNAGVGGSSVFQSRSCFTIGDPVGLSARLVLNHSGSISLFQRNTQVLFDLQTYGLLEEMKVSPVPVMPRELDGVILFCSL